jgi:4-diphosphocytidyl-2-C-methyl-D-erythritol kinase
MVITCNAKINIGLEILNKRYDDYHNINTIFRKICLSDELILEENDTFEFVFNANFDIPDKDNIAFKAAQQFMKLHRLNDLPVKLTINKKIPAGAGLGGGSSDAAMTLIGLHKFFNLPLDRERLMGTAVDLGADVPFFLLETKTALATGLGEELKEIELNLPYYILLVLPDVHISTADAYASLKRNYGKISPSDYLSALETAGKSPEKMKELFKNDFEDYVFAKNPELKQIKNELYQNGAFFAQMSGSGSAFYGFFRSKTAVELAVKNFKQYRTHICPPD